MASGPPSHPHFPIFPTYHPSQQPGPPRSPTAPGVANVPKHQVDTRLETQGGKNHKQAHTLVYMHIRARARTHTCIKGFMHTHLEMSTHDQIILGSINCLFRNEGTPHTKKKQVQRLLIASAVTPEYSVHGVSNKGQVSVFARPRPFRDQTLARHLPRHSHHKRKRDPKVPDFSWESQRTGGAQSHQGPPWSEFPPISAAPAHYWSKQMNMW